MCHSNGYYVRIRFCEILFWGEICRDFPYCSSPMVDSRKNTPGPLNIKTVFPGMEISIMKIRRSSDSLIFIIGIPVLVRHCYIETTPRFPFQQQLSIHWGWDKMVSIFRWHSHIHFMNENCILIPILLTVVSINNKFMCHRACAT